MAVRNLREALSEVTWNMFLRACSCPPSRIQSCGYVKSGYGHAQIISCLVWCQWLIPSMQEGRERDVVFTIMRRCFDWEYTGNPLQVLSVFTRDTLKGYIYLEARQQAAVQQALEGVNNVFLNKLRLVPVDEMVD